MGTSPSLEAFGIVTKTSTSPLEETMKLICLALFLTLGLVSGKPGPFSQDATEPETLKSDIVDPKESLERLEQIMEDVEDKVEVPESDENVVNDDLSDIDRWGCRDDPRYAGFCQHIIVAALHKFGYGRCRDATLIRICRKSCNCC